MNIVNPSFRPCAGRVIILTKSKKMVNKKLAEFFHEAKKVILPEEFANEIKILRDLGLDDSDIKLIATLKIKEYVTLEVAKG